MHKIKNWVDPSSIENHPDILTIFPNAIGDVEIDNDESKNESRIERKNQG